MPQDPTHRQLVTPRLKVKGTHLLILRHHLVGQASNLTHKSRSLLKHSLRMETGSYHLCAHPLLSSRVPVSPGRELSHTSGALIFVAASQGMFLNCLVLETREACVPGSMGTSITESPRKGITSLLQAQLCGCCQRTSPKSGGQLTAVCHTGL